MPQTFPVPQYLFSRLLAALVTLVLGTANASWAATFAVDPTASGCNSSGRPFCTVQAALAASAADPDPVITLAPGRHLANLRIARPVTLVGAGADQCFLDGGGAGRVLLIEPAARVLVRGVTITGGRLEKELERDGGGVWNLGTLTLERCTVADNVAIDDGGGIRNDGALTLSECRVENNRATRWGSVGGGIYNPVIVGTPTLEIIASTISGNVAGDHGGGLWCESDVTVRQSTISGNRAAHTGGGIRNNGNLTVIASTIAWNQAGTTGGGIYNLGTASLAQSILAKNTAAEGAADCHGRFAAHSRNLVQEAGGCELLPREGNLWGIDPELGPLADHGGATSTHALASASPAIDAGDRGTPCTGTDQRGNPRPADGDRDGQPVCDLGAFEATSRADGTP